MVDADIYDELPDDPEDAFLYLERHFKEECETNIRSAHENERIDVYHLEYISRVLSTIQELQLSPAFGARELPKIGEIDTSAYYDFQKDVEHFKTALSIRRAKRRRVYSVSFDAATKVKLRHYLEQIRETVDHLSDVGVEKKEALYQRINDLNLEIDRDRTRYEALAALAIDTAGITGEIVEKSRVLEVLNSIAQVFWGAKQAEPKKLLPAPERQKRLAAPVPNQSSNHKPLDDEIPF